ncbi:inositol monophosphatase family protein [Pseudolysinimonas yzui]|uniref:Inositol-1-monophosphatase n=1 Tax=Pseudolysinimonas yzui TaxID=2708254 RepID=A0A8J3GPW5_9MICO|nr:inositol monophosphatase family protein [Pseudolysinimonas yzui]GHF13697.1 inositol monophosphatase [Pseudolysinimonas yzui]
MTELLDLARTIALEAGELAARRRREGVAVAATKSTVVDVVTEADREVERLVLGRLQDARPSDGVLGEEGASVSGSSGLTWVVDPIDGTVNYLYGIPHYAVSIALVEGEPDPLTWTSKIGVVLNPATSEIFTAEAGAGAFCGERRLRVGGPTPLNLALIATGFAYAASTRGAQGEVIARLLPQVRDIRRQGTASLDLCFVADGRYDAFFERTLSPWDHAAGALVAREAGARVTGMRGAAPSSDLIIAAEPSVAARLEAVLDELGAFDAF